MRRNHQVYNVDNPHNLHGNSHVKCSSNLLVTIMAPLRWFVRAFALASALIWANAGFATESPQVQLQNVSDELLQQIRLRFDDFDKDDQLLYDFVNATLGGILDYDRILKIILGKKVYQEASLEQREAFAHSLKWQLIRLYAKIILKYADGDVRYLPFSHQTGKPYQMVRTEFLMSGKAPVDLTYLMREVEGNWYIFEIRADGIFLIKSLKDSLRPEIDQNGLDAVIQRLRSNESGETSRRFTLHAPA